MKEDDRKVISPQTTMREEEEEHDPAMCGKNDTLPMVPRQQVFEATLTQVAPDHVFGPRPLSRTPRDRSSGAVLAGTP